MASSHGSPNTHTESAKMEQIITEFFAKSLHIILESRYSYMSSRNFSGEHGSSPPSWSPFSLSSGARPRDKWFNLALRECPAALENIGIWRQSSLDPMIIDVSLVERPLDWNFDRDELGCGVKSEKIIERWIVQYECKKSRDSGSGSRRSGNTLHTLYKKSILLLRSLYLTVRLLPAYKIFRDQNSSGRIRTFSLAYKVSSFVDPSTRKEEAEMQRFGFTPVETSSGRLCLSVLYHSSVSDFSSEPSTPLSPQFIPDYVGSPLADPVKRFPSLPVSHGSPSSLPFCRRHSWSYDRYKASPPSFPCSPSPTHSEPHALISNPNSSRVLPLNLPPFSVETSSVHKRNMSFDEYSPSPNFTSSLSPSRPIYIPGSNLLMAHSQRSESAPVSIPTSKLNDSPVLPTRQNLPPSLPVKCTRNSSPKTDKCAGFVQTGAFVEKSTFLGKDDIKKYSGIKISSGGSPRISFSRSSSRSFPDDFDDSDFPCPFDVDDDDTTDPGSRPESFDQKGHLCDPVDPGGLLTARKSQDAAVGALVRMLRKAPPLCQDFSSSVDMLQDSGSKLCNISDTPALQQAASSVSSSRLAASKTTADGLEELRGYKEIMKDLLHNQGGRSNTSADGTPLAK